MENNNSINKIEQLLNKRLSLANLIIAVTKGRDYASRNNLPTNDYEDKLMKLHEQFLKLSDMIHNEGLVLIAG